jgi:hypothetical protein
MRLTCRDVRDEDDQGRSDKVPHKIRSLTAEAMSCDGVLIEQLVS